MHHIIKHHIHNADLHKRLSIHSLNYYYNSRLLRWAGHVARMDMTRIPRKLLTGWVAHPRPNGRPYMTFGHTLKKALKAKKLPTAFAKWRMIAANRPLWRQFHTTVTYK